MAAALAQGVEDVAGFCRAQGISRQSYYKWKKRFDVEGLDGLRDRSRRPNVVPNATPAEVEDAIVAAVRPGSSRTADQQRADALVALARGTSARPAKRGPAVQVSVALSTLLGMDNQPGELDGYGPVPATLARRLADDPTGTWRRLVTDQHGQLLDYGRSTYRPPANLRDHVVARDRTCRMPGCSRAACRCDIDHVTSYERGGTTCAENAHALCCRHHHLKHDAGWTVTRTDGGITRWRSPLGRI